MFKIKNFLGKNRPTTQYVIWQSIMWDRFAKASPFIFISILLSFYFLGFRNLRLVIESMLTMFGIVSIFWWFWVVYTIIRLANIIDTSSEGLKEIIQDIKYIKSEVKELEKISEDKS